MHRAMCFAAVVLGLLCHTAPAAGAAQAQAGRRLFQTINYAAGYKFGPQLENYFSLRSAGGPYSSIQGERKTDVKTGSPPQPPAFQYSFNPKRSDTGAKAGGDAKGGDRRLMQTINYAAGYKFGPQLENYFSLRSAGGPYSSIQGERKTDVKTGSPPQPPAFQYSFNPKRSDTGAKAGGDAKGGDRRLMQTINYAAGYKFGPQLENYFSLRSAGGPYSSIQGERKTDVKTGSPPQPPAFQYSFNPKRSDTGAKAGGDAKGGDRRRH